LPAPPRCKPGRAGHTRLTNHSRARFTTAANHSAINLKLASRGFPVWRVPRFAVSAFQHPITCNSSTPRHHHQTAPKTQDHPRSHHRVRYRCPRLHRWDDTTGEINHRYNPHADSLGFQMSGGFKYWHQHHISHHSKHNRLATSYFLSVIAPDSIAVTLLKRSPDRQRRLTSCNHNSILSIQRPFQATWIPYWH